MRRIFLALFLALMIVGLAALTACAAAPAADVAANWAAEPIPAPMMLEEQVLSMTGGGRLMMDMDMDMDDSAWLMETPEALIYGGADIVPTAASAVRMLIQRAEIEMRSDYFDRDMEGLRGMAAEFGGYVQSSGLSGGQARSFSITMRIPSADFEAAMRRVERFGEVTWMHQDTEDVTDQLADVQRRMEARLIEEDRLLELVAHATDLRQLLTIEDRLTQVRMTIEFYRGTLANLGDRVAFSTINVRLWEFLEDDEPEAPGFGARMAGAFTTSADVTWTVLQGLMVVLSAAIIPLSLMGAIALAIILLVRFLSKRARLKNPPPPYMPPPVEVQTEAETPED